MWQVGVWIHVGIASVSDKEISASPKNWSAIDVIANAVRFLDDVVFGDLKVRLWRAESEKKSAFWLNVAAFAISFCESNVSETAADISAISLKRHLNQLMSRDEQTIKIYQCDDHKRRNSIAMSVESCGCESVNWSSINKPPVLLCVAEESVQSGLKMHFVVTQDVGAGIKVEWKPRLKTLIRIGRARWKGWRCRGNSLHLIWLKCRKSVTLQNELHWNCASRFNLLGKNLTVDKQDSNVMNYWR